MWQTRKPSKNNLLNDSMKTRLAALALTLIFHPVLAQETAGAPAVDRFKVTDDVLQKSPPNFSTNVQFGGFAPWSPCLLYTSDAADE